MAKTIRDVLSKYYKEAVGGMVEKSPSTLNRGEGAELDYYIFKIDLVDSTIFTWTRTQQTYLKLTHTFLSSVAEITRDFGADDDQVEYLGDSIIAYFRASKVAPMDVITAAYWCREAALEMRSLDATLNKFHFKTKSVFHYGKLIMAKIGPRGSSFASAIGPELHKACKMEARVSPGQGLVSKEFRDKLQGREKFILEPNYKEIQVLKQPESIPYSDTRTQSIANLLMNGCQPSGLSRGIMPLNTLASFSQQQATPGPKYETKKEVIDYSIKWDVIPKILNISK